MPKKFPSDIAELLNRAEADTSPKNVPMQKATPRPIAQSAPTPPPQRRDVYGGNFKPKAQKREREHEYIVPQANKKVVAPKKRRSTFNIVAVLFLAAIAIVLYIGNILKVNQLVVEVNQLQQQYDRIQNSNSILQAEINRKSAWERVGEAAKQQGLTYAKERPQTLDVDEGKLEKFEGR